MRGVTAVNAMFSDPMPFQLTRLMRGVTRGAGRRGRGLMNFNSHASCEA